MNRRLLVDVCGSLFARGSAAVGAMLLSLVVGHFYGAEILGKLTIFVSIWGVFAIMGRRGLDMILTREVARVVHGSDAGQVPGLIGMSIRIAVVSSLVLSIPGALLIGSDLFNISSFYAAAMFPFCLVAIVIITILSGYVRGTKQAWASPIMQSGGTSAFAGVVILVWVKMGGGLQIRSVFLLFSLATVLFCIMVAFLPNMNWWSSLRNWNVPDEGKGARDIQVGSYRAQLAFTITALAVFVSQAGSFSIVGPFLAPETVGVLRIAERLGVLVAFGVMAINPIIAARIVKYGNTGRPAELKRLVAKACLASAAIGVVPLLVLLLWPGQVLVLVGHGYIEAVPYVRILALSNFVVALLGPFAMVMNMMNRERELMWLSVAALLFSVVTYPVASSLWGGWGFVGAYATAAVGRSLAVAWLAVAAVSGCKNVRSYA